jgi:REP element-mobilizing transposase RayT
MPVSSELPKKCQECAKSVGPIIYNKCNFCRDLEFNEEILCNLNQCIQNPINFKCHAFRPILKLTTPSVNKVSDLSHHTTDNPPRKSIQELLKSDKTKYKKALALQKLQRDPDGVFMECKYHFAWNVIHRRPVFTHRNDFLDFAHHTFSGCSDLVGGFVSLLWLAPDHVHLYVMSDGGKSVETIVQEIKQSSNDAIMGELADTKDRFDAGNELWDTAYFAETIG